MATRKSSTLTVPAPKPASTLEYGSTVSEAYGIAALPMLKPGQAKAKCVGCSKVLPRSKYPTTAAKGEQPATARRTQECRACRNSRQGRPSREAAKVLAAAKAAKPARQARAKARAATAAQAAQERPSLAPLAEELAQAAQA